MTHPAKLLKYWTSDQFAPTQLVYTPLQDSPESIRLAYLQPGEGSAPIKVNLALFKLDIQPEYRALSYTWGDPTITKRIFIDGYEFTVRNNLWSALYHLRHQRVNWKDFISLVRYYSEVECDFPNVKRILALNDLRNSGTLIGEMYSLFHLLSSFRDVFCGDPRDKIYAFLGMANDYTKREFPVDYSKSLFEVYQDIVKFHRKSSRDSTSLAIEMIYFSALFLLGPGGGSLESLSPEDFEARRPWEARENETRDILIEWLPHYTGKAPFSLLDYWTSDQNDTSPFWSGYDIDDIDATSPYWSQDHPENLETWQLDKESTGTTI
ncbi:hypothetical protein G7Y89_g11547 [Cudoniella acicularis]|uniref:Heterokaryon incompatibility domain-containing protein n=1 Tax=Cudoniella acicularis TaxID=354080 RepID=A0A8H4VY71_9HELO|nr:hypothetical protein G7Y89_g11547 [Cudoniella acicularis]